MPPFRSLFTREREFPSRVKTELEQRERERLASITEPFSDCQDHAFKELQDEVGHSKILSQSGDFGHKAFVCNADTILVLSYLEYLLNGLSTQARGRYPKSINNDTVVEVVDKIRDVLVTEGLLYELEHDSGNFKFRQLESEAMEDIDKEIQALGEEQQWSDALEGYNEAFEMYLRGEFDDKIPKKLYYSIEEVLKIICVDEEEWTDNRDLVHSEYLSMLKENDVYKSHGATAAEMGQFIDSLETMVAKIGGDRKQEHAWHDRAYATLLIHQVGAYLYFIINRYNEFSN
jgi:hypothetical protein